MHIKKFAKAGIVAVSAALIIITGCDLWKDENSTNDIPVVKNFDAARYMGVWYEIARLPQWFERDLTNVTATYTIENDRLKVVNRGFRDGEEVIATAVGKFAGAADEGAFRISFARPFYGDYKIIWLSEDYDLSLVTSSNRDSLWILAREKDVSTSALNTILNRARDLRFDLSNLIWVQ